MEKSRHLKRNNKSIKKMRFHGNPKNDTILKNVQQIIEHDDILMKLCFSQSPSKIYKEVE